MFVQGKCSDSPSKKKRNSLQKSASTSKIPKKKNLIFSENSGVKNSRFKTESLGKSRMEKSPSTSLKRTAASSMTNLFR